jgi:hypothetical protein
MKYLRDGDGWKRGKHGRKKKNPGHKYKRRRLASSRSGGVGWCLVTCRIRTGRKENKAYGYPPGLFLPFPGVTCCNATVSHVCKRRKQENDGLLDRQGRPRLVLRGCLLIRNRLSLLPLSCCCTTSIFTSAYYQPARAAHHQPTLARIVRAPQDSILWNLGAQN